MFLYKVCPTNIRALPFEVSEETFINEWRACWEDKNRDKAYLVELMRPAIEHWRKLLTREAEPDILMVSLCASLGKDPDEALDLIDKWIERSLETVEDALWTIFLEQIRGMRYFPSFAKPVMAEYVIVQGFKRRLVRKIKHNPYKLEYVPFTNDMLTEVDYITIPDYFFLKHLKLNKWEAYLLWWLKNRRYYKDGANISRTPFISYKLKERKLWHLLRENYF